MLYREREREKEREREREVVNCITTTVIDNLKNSENLDISIS